MNQTIQRQTVILQICPALADYHIEHADHPNFNHAVILVDNHDCPYCGGTPISATLYTGTTHEIPSITPQELIA